uniref:Uncharacterized protein n=1 Tax=Megaviridae environmental sample TaxID=1737588 RepID=A0A5J6VL33_9VIRU|nr:MAG: hypothetical protein [Megaviridae environmental sample]
MTIQYGNISDVWGDSKVHHNFTKSNITNKEKFKNNYTQYNETDDNNNNNVSIQQIENETKETNIKSTFEDIKKTLRTDILDEIKVLKKDLHNEIISELKKISKPSDNKMYREHFINIPNSNYISDFFRKNQHIILLVSIVLFFILSFCTNKNKFEIKQNSDKIVVIPYNDLKNILNNLH